MCARKNLRSAKKVVGKIWCLNLNKKYAVKVVNTDPILLIMFLRPKKSCLVVSSVVIRRIKKYSIERIKLFFSDIIRLLVDSILC